MGRRIVTETVTDEMLQAAKDVCKNYTSVCKDCQSFDLYRSVLAEKYDASQTDWERRMYQEMIDDAAIKNSQRLIWIHRADWALNRISKAKPREVVRQYYFEGVPLKLVADSDGTTMNTSTADYHKKNGLQLLAIELHRFDELYPDKAAEAAKVEF